MSPRLSPESAGALGGRVHLLLQETWSRPPRPPRFCLIRPFPSPPCPASVRRSPRDPSGWWCSGPSSAAYNDVTLRSGTSLSLGPPTCRTRSSISRVQAVARTHPGRPWPSGLTSRALISLPCLRNSSRLCCPQIHKLPCAVTAPGDPSPSATTATVQTDSWKEFLARSIPVTDVYPHSKP